MISFYFTFLSAIYNTGYGGTLSLLQQLTLYFNSMIENNLMLHSKHNFWKSIDHILIKIIKFLKLVGVTKCITL